MPVATTGKPAKKHGLKGAVQVIGKSRLNVDKNKPGYARSVRIGYPMAAKGGD